MATETQAAPAAFLTIPVTEARFLTPEQFDDEQRLVRESARTFIQREVLPRSEAIDHQESGVLPGLVRQAGEQGLLMVDVPETHGGAELGLVVSAIVAAEMREASFAVAHGAHTTIGTLPIVFYGTEDQKRRYLPRLATGEMIGAYALTEPGVGSDAMAIRTRAELAPDGTHYILNGSKQWISNAGFADLMIVFAKVDDTQHTAFIVETAWPGISTGAEEKKMGIKGSSTRSVYFDNVRVPAENVLGTIGKGYKIAFNILNIGRLKLGAGTAGGARAALDMAAKYATERKAFGQPIASFGLIKKKLARMAADAYAAEALTYRTVGMVESVRRDAGADEQAQLAAIEDYAIECSIAKVYGSEALGRCVDEGVQIFGGYGFMQDYPIEKAYRDARINRIFEGTNEVNRLVAAGTLFTRAAKGQLAVFAAFPEVASGVASGPAPDFAGADAPDSLRDAVNLVERAKRASIYAVMKGAPRFMATMRDEEEFLEYVANLLIDVYAADSAVGRALQAARSGVPDAPTHALLAQVAVLRLLPELRESLDGLLVRALEGAERERELATVRAYLGDPQTDIVPLQRELADLIAAKGGYPFD